jgi:large subunit ribosomal protein L10
VPVTDTAPGAHRREKVAVVREVRERLGSSTAAVLTEYRGLTVAELSQLRAELRRSDAEYTVVKNTLTRLAARDAGFDVPDSLLTGPTAVTFCAGDPIAVAKILRGFSRQHPSLVVKGGFFEGQVLDAAATLQLAELETREELLARFAGLMEAVVAQPARLALASLSKAARLFAALQDKKAATAADGTSAAPESTTADAAGQTPTE